MKYTDYEYTPEEIEHVKKILIDMWISGLEGLEEGKKTYDLERYKKLYTKVETMSLKELCDELGLSDEIYKQFSEKINNSVTSKLKFGGYLLAKFAAFKIFKTAENGLPEISYQEIREKEEIKFKRYLIDAVLEVKSTVVKLGVIERIAASFEFFMFLKNKLEEDPILFCQIANEVISTYDRDISYKLSFDNCEISERIYFQYKGSDIGKSVFSPSRTYNYREDIRKASDYLDMVIQSKKA